MAARKDAVVRCFLLFSTQQDEFVDRGMFSRSTTPAERQHSWLLLAGVFTLTSTWLSLLLCCCFALKCQQRDTVKCKLLHGRDSQHGSVDATICAERSKDGSQQQVTIFSMHSVNTPAQDSDSSSYAYAQAAEGTEFGHRRRRVVHRKTLLYLAQQ
jgi:hypothetical protein